jgi:membrane protein
MKVAYWYARAKRFLLKDMWVSDLTQMSRWPKLGLRTLRMISLASHGFLADKCSLRAAKLTLVFLLSLPPTLAVTFSVAKGFGASTQLKELLLGLTAADQQGAEAPGEGETPAEGGGATPESVTPDAAPAAPPKSASSDAARAAPPESASPDGAPAAPPSDADTEGVVSAQAGVNEILKEVLDYVDNTNVTALGFLGLLLLLWTSYTLLSTIERTMNDIWGVRRPRPPGRKVVDYAAVLFVSPIMLIVGVTVNASIQVGQVMSKQQDDGLLSEGLAFLLNLPWVATLVGILVPLFLATCAFAFLFAFFPNTRVPLRSALVGAFTTAVLLFVLVTLFVRLQVGVARANAVYGTFAAVPILLLMFNACWLGILYGAEVSYAHANQKEIQFGGLSFKPSVTYLQQLAVGAMVMAGRAFEQQDPPIRSEEIAYRLGAPVRVMRDVVNELIQARLLVEVQEDTPAFQPAAPLEKITLGRILSVMKDAGDRSERTEATLDDMGVLEPLHAERDADLACRQISLLDLVNRAGAATPHEAEGAGEV